MKLRLAIFSISAAILVGLLLPTANDVMVRQTVTKFATYQSATSAFSWSSFTSQLSGLINSWIASLFVYKDSVVAAYEKQDGALKEITQGKINYKASAITAQAAQESLDNVMAISPEACEITIQNREMVDARKSQDLYAKAFAGATVSRAVNNTNAKKIADEMLATSQTDYCSPEMVERGRCRTVSPKNMPDADVSATSLFHTQSGESETFSDDELEAAKQFVFWSTDPIPPENVLISNENTESGRRFLIEQQRRAALLSVAQHSMAQNLAARRVQN